MIGEEAVDGPLSIGEAVGEGQRGDPWRPSACGVVERRPQLFQLHWAREAGPLVHLGEVDRAVEETATIDASADPEEAAALVADARGTAAEEGRVRAN